MKNVDLLIIGAGPSGLCASVSAYKEGIKDILVIERNNVAGGILNQCIHNGFGLHLFKEELTGPEFAQKLIDEAQDLNIPILYNTMVLNVTKDKVVTILSENGVEEICAKAIILSMGCRERPRGAINIAGSRCAGIFSAGTAQELINMKGYNIGKEAVILGSGDIGLIMARRLTFEDVKVKAVIELMPYSSGLTRNIVQCVTDFDIPLKYSSTITKIVGTDRVEGVYVAKVDENKKPIKETEEFIPCDTILLSVGLIPENDLTKEIGVEISNLTSGAFVDNNYATNIEGVFACGNVLHVHDLVDYVAEESMEAGKSAAAYINATEIKDKKLVEIKATNGVRYAVPQYLDCNNISSDLELKFRPDNVYTKHKVIVTINGEEVFSKVKKIVTPGEMEKIKISKDILSAYNIEGIEIFLRGGTDG